MSQEKQINQFVRKELFRKRTNPLEKFVLRHAGVASKGQEVEEFAIPPEMNGDQVESFVSEVLAKAQSDADGLGNKLQRYVLIALEMDRNDGSRLAFRIQGEAEADDGEEAPTEKGLLAQTMRHNEVLMRMATMGAQQTIVSLTRQNEEQGRTINQLQARQIEGFAVLESAKSQQHEREVELLLVAGKEERKNSAMGNVVQKLEMLFPVLINKLAGKAILSVEEKGMLSGLISSLSEDQLKNIAANLKPEQQLAFFKIYQEMKKQQEKETTTS